MGKSHRISQIASAKDEVRIESQEIIQELKKALKEKDEENVTSKHHLKEINII
jgi:serine/threonine protein phosphatase PrpC